MRVALISEDSVSPCLAGGFRTVNCAKELKRRGHSVIIFAPSQKPEVEGIKVTLLPHPVQGISVLKLLFAVIWFEVVVFFRLFKARKEFDSILLRSEVPSAAAYPFAKLFGKKIMLDMTDIQAEYLKAKGHSFFQKKIVSLIVGIEYHFLRKFKRIITVSKAMKELLVKNGIRPDRIEVVYDGADLSKFKPLDKIPMTIIHHGGISIQDGLDILPKAASIVLKSFPDARFNILGKGNQLEHVKSVAKEENVEYAFNFTGWLPFEEMLKILGSSSIGVVTRPDTVPNNTVLTLKLLEYWATGTVPVVPRLKAIREVATDGKDVMLFAPGDHKDLAEKLIFLLDGKERASRMGKAGIEISKRFDWSLLAGQIIDIVEKELV